MGLFDSIYVTKAVEEETGLKSGVEWQTKELGCMMYQYVLANLDGYISLYKQDPDGPLTETDNHFPHGSVEMHTFNDELGREDRRDLWFIEGELVRSVSLKPVRY